MPKKQSQQGSNTIDPNQQVHAEDFDDLDEIDDDLEDADESASSSSNDQIANILAELSKGNKQILSQVSNIDKRFDSLTKKVDNHEERITKIEKCLQQAPVSTEIEEEGEKSGVDSFLDATFGTIGHIGHTIVDTVAFVAESVVDIITLGRAKRTN